MQIREVFDRKRFVFLDGGMGTQLQARGLQPGQKPELAALEMPEVLTAIHTDYANAGADILLAPHQTGGTNSRSPFGMKPVPVALWQNRYQDPDALKAAFQGRNGREWLLRWLPSRAHDNGMIILLSNGVGLDNGEVRTGNAMIIDPYGRIIAETDAFEDTLVCTTLDLNLLAMSTGRRWIHGRRPELYAILSQNQGY